jgi:4'-phosphopantetheinyl transferase
VSPQELHAWQPRPAQLLLGADEVHVWRAPLDSNDPGLARLAGTLVGDEQERARRYYFEKDRRHFIAGRGLLREILGSYLGWDPARLGFTYGAHGKPSLAEPASPLCFNVSHSAGLLLVALAWGRQVGVDVERINEELRHAEIAERFFSAHERAALAALPPALREQAFFACWTRKEAYIKARGRGLSIPLASFDVALAPGLPVALLASRDDPRQEGRWSLMELAPGPGYAGALAVEGKGWRLWCGQWPDEE